ncbi:hypothetical protein FRB99_004091 [Tulasnella sp. 403]|nr:hypothetical protein FRB99_004091 [Tulasnella sp. 403]
MKTLARLERYRVKRSQISFKDPNTRIGQAGFSGVYRGRLAGKPVAVKRLYSDQSGTSRLAIDLAREASVWEMLNHPNVLPFIGFCHETEQRIAWLISPYMRNGTLVEYMTFTKPSVERRLQLAYDTALGLNYLHSRSPPVIHGDVKTKNYLVNDAGVAVLHDFGLSKSVGETPHVLMDTTFRRAGTLHFEAPELLLHDTYKTMRGDVWAWGCTLLHLMTGLGPYYHVESEGAVVRAIMDENPPADLAAIGGATSIKDLMASCWDFNPEGRPTMAECSRVLAGEYSETLSSERVLTDFRDLSCG